MKLYASVVRPSLIITLVATNTVADGADERIKEERNKHFYRCKEKDKVLYAELKRIMARFLTLEALLEVAHTMDTNANESLNNTISWIAPKNKVLCGTLSLAICIGIALGITSVGTKVY